MARLVSTLQQSGPRVPRSKGKGKAARASPGAHAPSGISMAESRRGLGCMMDISRTPLDKSARVRLLGGEERKKRSEAVSEFGAKKFPKYICENWKKIRAISQTRPQKGERPKDVWEGGAEIDPVYSSLPAQTTLAVDRYTVDRGTAEEITHRLTLRPVWPNDHTATRIQFPMAADWEKAEQLKEKAGAEAAPTIELSATTLGAT
eukprot:g12728.t1